MKARMALGLVSILLTAGGAAAQLAPGDRILVDVGVCWSGDPRDPDYGPMEGPDALGRHWNNYAQNPKWNSTPVPLVDTAGNATGATFLTNRFADCFACGGVLHDSVGQSTLYPVRAQTDARWWCQEIQPGHVYLEGLDPALVYDVRLFGYADANATIRDIGEAFPGGTTIYSIGALSFELNNVDNTTEIAELFSVAPAGDGSMLIEMVAGTPAGCGAVLNVVDITVIPEPGAILLLALAGPLLLRRRVAAGARGAGR